VRALLLQARLKKRQRRVEKAQELLVETADELLSLAASEGPRVEEVAREALLGLREPVGLALEALEVVEGQRELTEEERAGQRAFEMLLAASRNVG
jgi:hypothetical protein